MAEDGDNWRADVTTVMNIRVPKHSWNFLTSCENVSFSKKNSAPWRWLKLAQDAVKIVIMQRECLGDSHEMQRM